MSRTLLISYWIQIYQYSYFVSTIEANLKENLMFFFRILFAMYFDLGIHKANSTKYCKVCNFAATHFPWYVSLTMPFKYEISLFHSIGMFKQKLN